MRLYPLFASDAGIKAEKIIREYTCSMQSNKLGRSPWIGVAAILPGISAFRGDSGDNREHYHWAHQFSIGLSQPVRIIVGDHKYEARALFVRAGTKHQLLGGKSLSIFLDPTSQESKAVCQSIGEITDIIEPPKAIIDTIERAFHEGCSVSEGLACLRVRLKVEEQPTNTKLKAVLRLLEASLDSQQPVSRRKLADLIGVSESRFSHWFRDQTGMPLRSYKKWLRLIRGIEKVLQGHSLTDAAYDVDFADQAHFTRTFIQMFGVKPSVAFAQVVSDSEI